MVRKWRRGERGRFCGGSTAGRAKDGGMGESSRKKPDGDGDGGGGGPGAVICVDGGVSGAIGFGGGDGPGAIVCVDGRGPGAIGGGGDEDITDLTTSSDDSSIFAKPRQRQDRTWC